MDAIEFAKLVQQMREFIAGLIGGGTFTLLAMKCWIELIGRRPNTMQPFVLPPDAVGPQSPGDESSRSNPTICKRGREVVLIFDTFEEAEVAFDLMVDFQPRILPKVADDL